MDAPKTIVRTRLGGDDVADVLRCESDERAVEESKRTNFWDVFFGVSTLNDGVREDGIGRRYARRDAETLDLWRASAWAEKRTSCERETHEGEVGNQQENEARRNEPSDRHDRNQKDGERTPLQSGMCAVNSESR